MGDGGLALKVSDGRSRLCLKEDGVDDGLIVVRAVMVKEVTWSSIVYANGYMIQVCSGFLMSEVV